MDTLTRAIVLTVLLGLAPTAAAQQARSPLLAEHPELRELLREEMQALLEGLQHISTALAQGQWATVAEHAQAMHDSYILQQRLSPEQRRTLRHSLPAGFMQLDKQFHRYAGRLRDAAVKEDAELSVHFLARAVDTCMRCHRRFAAGRFPGLTPGTSGGGASH